jgi:hypothetical protein
MTAATIDRTASVSGSGVYRFNAALCSYAAGTNTVANRPVYVLPAWTRHGTQPEHWTETWLHKEKLADWDAFIGNTFETNDVEALIQELHA